MDSIKYTDKVLEYVKDYMYPSEGAMVVDVKEEGDKLDIPPMIIINRNGATNYETRELGTLYSRMERFKAIISTSLSISNIKYSKLLLWCL